MRRYVWLGFYPREESRDSGIFALPTPPARRGQVQSFRLPRSSKSAATPTRRRATRPSLLLPLSCFSLVVEIGGGQRRGVRVDDTTQSAMCRGQPGHHRLPPLMPLGKRGFRWRRCWCLRRLPAATESRLAAALPKLSPDLGHRQAGPPANLPPCLYASAQRISSTEPASLYLFIIPY